MTATRCGSNMLLTADVDSAERRRLKPVIDTAGHRIEADSLGVFLHGVPAKYPSVVIDGHREDFTEYNIPVMRRHEIAGFLDAAPYLDLDGYLPVNDMLLLLFRHP